MRLYTRNFILTAVSSLALLFLCPTLQASGIILTLTGNPSFGYEGILVGPYVATLDNDPNSLVFCLDLHINTYVNRDYQGALSHPSTQAEEEAAFLASYSLHLGAPSGSLVNTVEGPISMAIWQLMGTLGSTAPDPAAAPYIQLAQSAYSSGRISDTLLNRVQIWSPASGVQSQRFITAVRDERMIEDTVPELSTLVLLGSGVLLMAASRAVVAIRNRTRRRMSAGCQMSDQ
ncbi:MAG: hypothetical protein NTW28_08000 [Candidatus Solibacter sp.]|nr:hypothetical protein [Candidatus Solibacter sp.]